jgi:hypothetical protein
MNDGKENKEKIKKWIGANMKKVYNVLITVLLVSVIALSFSCSTTGTGPKDDLVTETEETEKAGESPGGEVDGEESGGDMEDREDISGEKYFVNAILKSIDMANNIIVVEQLINDPDETIIEPEVKLSPDYKVVRSELDMENSDEKYTDITLEDIPLDSEIGIMFGGDGRAELIIYQVITDLDDEEVLENTVLGFLDAIEAGQEYDYFSSGTVSIVGTEEEYRSGDKSDIYFILSESHSNWEDISVTEVTVEGDTAYVEITGDRMVEGIKYEEDQVTFTLVDEQGTWKIDFSS